MCLCVCMCACACVCVHLCVCVWVTALGVCSEAYFSAVAKMGEQAMHTLSSRSLGKCIISVCVCVCEILFVCVSVCVCVCDQRVLLSVEPLFIHCV